MLVQALLGIQPDAPNDRLYVDPWLPEWLPEITLTDLRVGHHVLDLRFARDGGATQVEVTRGDRHVVERRSLVEAAELMRAGARS
jgi:cellobiose phosphorylase